MQLNSVLIKPVTHIVKNLSIQSRIVPCELKNARVVPLSKKNQRSDVSNYQPVRVLSVLSKILEKAVYVQLEGYLVNNNFMSFSQVFEVNFQQTHVCPTRQISLNMKLLRACILV